MQIAIISDIHGNLVGLDAVLADLKEYPTETIVCLGDAIQGGPQPAQVVARLRELACPVVMGNADAWMLTGVETGQENITPERHRKMETVREWSLSCLTSEDKDFISKFHPTVEIPLRDTQNLLCFHGSPTSFDEVILPETPEEDFHRILGTYTPHILTGGHTHRQFIRHIWDSFFFNPGTVGLAYSHIPINGKFRLNLWAEYAVLTVEGGRMGLEFRRVPINRDELLQSYHESGRPFANEAVAEYLP